MQIKIMSFNTQHCLNFVTKEIDFDIMADAIIKCHADIIGLQEMRDESANEEYQAQAKIIAEKLGFYYYFAEAIRFDGKNPYGNALISRYPIISAETIIIPDPVVPEYDGYYETRCLLKAIIDVDDGLNVLVSHFGLNPDEHRNAVETIVANISSERCVVMGDFNVEPDNPVLLSIREKLYDTAEQFDESKLSFPSDVPDRKIDYIFVSKDIMVSDADIPEVIASDHRPHTATIEI